MTPLGEVFLHLPGPVRPYPPSMEGKEVLPQVRWGNHLVVFEPMMIMMTGPMVVLLLVLLLLLLLVGRAGEEEE